jgi:hypothetical protein
MTGGGSSSGVLLTNGTCSLVWSRSAFRLACFSALLPELTANACRLRLILDAQEFEHYQPCRCDPLHVFRQSSSPFSFLRHDEPCVVYRRPFVRGIYKVRECSGASRSELTNRSERRRLKRRK